MKLFIFVIAAVIILTNGNIVIEKWDIQYDKAHMEVKHELKDASRMFIDIFATADADDIMLEMVFSSFIDGRINPALRPDPAHICKMHEHEEPLIRYIHEEAIKYGNLTKACPLIKGAHYYMHDFIIDETKLPMPIPPGEYRVDINSSLIQNGNKIPLSATELVFKKI